MKSYLRQLIEESCQPATLPTHVMAKRVLEDAHFVRAALGLDTELRPAFTSINKEDLRTAIAISLITLTEVGISLNVPEVHDFTPLLGRGLFSRVIK
jgi:hypothetical protein